MTTSRRSRVVRESRHLRLLVGEDEPFGVLHVRDTFTCPPGTTAAELMRPVLTLDATTPIYAALSIMRESRTHLALVEEEEELIGLVTMQDMLDRLLLAGTGRGTLTGSIRPRGRPSGGPPATGLIGAPCWVSVSAEFPLRRRVKLCVPTVTLNNGVTMPH